MESASSGPISGIDLTGAVWIKASASGVNGGGCIELARVGDVIALRDSKNPDRPAHLYTPHELKCFLHGVKAGEFDSLLS